MKIRIALVVVFVVGTFGLESLCAGAKADTGHVAIVFTKGGLVVGAGRGKGVLTLRRQRYPFTVSGLSVGFTLGVSRARLTGHALNITSPESIEGSYNSVGAGGAFALGAGAVKLKNDNGVILILNGPRAGLEISAAAIGATIELVK